MELKRYFASYDGEKVYVWKHGKTSYSASNNREVRAYRNVKLYRE